MFAAELWPAPVPRERRYNAFPGPYAAPSLFAFFIFGVVSRSRLWLWLLSTAVSAAPGPPTNAGRPRDLVLTGALSDCLHRCFRLVAQCCLWFIVCTGFLRVVRHDYFWSTCNLKSRRTPICVLDIILLIIDGD